MKSKPTGTLSSRSNAAHTYSEDELLSFAKEWVAEFRGKKIRAPRILFDGEMGAGKSTLARAFLDAFGVEREAEGSPTFAIAHEYRTDQGQRILHADGYRLKSEAELEATGLLEVLWDSEVIVLFEWLELFSETRQALQESDLFTLWIKIERIAGSPHLRRIRVSTSGGHRP